jgi:hypothetical protein
VIVPFEGLVFRALARAVRGSSLLGKEPGHLMAATVTAVVRGGRAFSGGAIAHVVEDVGADVTRCRDPSVTAP